VASQTLRKLTAPKYPTSRPGHRESSQPTPKSHCTTSCDRHSRRYTAVCTGRTTQYAMHREKCYERGSREPGLRHRESPRSTEKCHCTTSCDRQKYLYNSAGQTIRYAQRKACNPTAVISLSLVYEQKPDQRPGQIVRAVPTLPVGLVKYSPRTLTEALVVYPNVSAKKVTGAWS
jgi:hypothetical protein